jgi:hypothetical protein
MARAGLQLWPGMEGPGVRVVFCWTDISGYMAACWRELARRAGVEPHVVAYAPHAASNLGFEAGVMAGVAHRLLPEAEHLDAGAWAREVLPLRPDVVVMAGWFNPGLRALRARPELAGAKFVMCMDNPWTGSWQQRLARLKVGR